MTKAEQHGVVANVEYVITGNNNYRVHGLANHKFQIGELVKLEEDDGTMSPKFINSSGSCWYVHVNNVKLAEAAGPRKGVRWTDAPKGATHYSLNDAYYSKWHKVEDGVLSFWYLDNREWKVYSEQRDLEVYKLVKVPKSEETLVHPVKETLKVELAKVEQRLTRTGSKLGRAKKQLADVQKAFDELKVEQAEIKGKIAATPDLTKITSAKELVELMHDASKWKAGMRVVNRSDVVDSITIGEKYLLTHDAQTHSHVSIYFTGDNGNERMRPASHYQLVTTDLV